MVWRESGSVSNLPQISYFGGIFWIKFSGTSIPSNNCYSGGRAGVSAD